MPDDKSLLRIKTLLISMELVEAPRSSYQFQSSQSIRSAVMRIKVLCSENFDRSFGTMSDGGSGNFFKNVPISIWEFSKKQRGRFCQTPDLDQDLSLGVDFVLPL